MEQIERDELLGDAAIIIVREQNASTSLIQRKLKLGYNRAFRVMEQLVEIGVVTQDKENQLDRKVNFKTEKEVCDFLKLEFQPREDECVTDKCTYPNCNCHPERLGAITAGELNRKGISTNWLKLWAEVQNFYGDWEKAETQEEFLRRMQAEFKLDSN